MNRSTFTKTAGAKECQRHRVIQLAYEAVPLYPNSRHSLEIKEERYTFGCQACGYRSELVTEAIQVPEPCEP